MADAEGTLKFPKPNGGTTSSMLLSSNISSARKPANAQGSNVVTPLPVRLRALLKLTMPNAPAGTCDTAFIDRSRPPATSPSKHASPISLKCTPRKDSVACRLACGESTWMSTKPRELTRRTTEPSKRSRPTSTILRPPNALVSIVAMRGLSVSTTEPPNTDSPWKALVCTLLNLEQFDTNTLPFTCV